MWRVLEGGSEEKGRNLAAGEEEEEEEIRHGARKRLIWVSARKKSNCFIICFKQFYGVLKEIIATLYNINTKQKFPSKLRGLEGSHKETLHREGAR